MSMLRLSGLVLSFACAGFVTAGAAEDAAQPRLLVVVDQSASMKQNDPRRYTTDGVQLLIGSMRENKRMTITGFARGSDVIVPWTAFTDRSRRTGARDTVSDKLDYNGWATNYVKALNLAYTQLGEENAPRGSKVLFFTDGNPDDSEAEILSVVQHFRERGWAIDTLRLTIDDPPTPLLPTISARTGGQFNQVTNAAILVERFAALASDESDSFVWTRHAWPPGTAVEVLPGTNRLNIVVVKQERAKPRGRLISLQVDGQSQPIGDEACYRYPTAETAEASKANLEVVDIDHPKAGKWTAGFEGTPASVYVSLMLDLRAQPLPIPDEVPEGTTVTTGLQIISPSAALLQGLQGSAGTEVVIRDDAGHEVFSQKLVPKMAGDGSLIYSGPWTATIPPGRSRDKAMPVVAEYKLTWKSDYQLTKSDAFSVIPRKEPLPAPPATPAAPPATVEFTKPTGPLVQTWVDQPADARIPVKATGPVRSLALPASNGFSFDPVQVPGAEAITAHFRPSRPGVSKAEIAVPDHTGGPLVLEGQAYPWSAPGPLRLTGSGPTTLPSFSPGAADLPAQPLKPLQATLAGPGGATLPVAIGADGVAKVTATANQPAGLYTGEVPVQFGNLPVRPLRIEVQQAVPSTKLRWGEGTSAGDAGAAAGEGGVIRIAEKTPGEWPEDRWLETTIPVAFETGVAGTWSITCSDLVGPDHEVVKAAYDLRMAFDQPRLAPGQSTKLKIRALHPIGMAPGDYHGAATLTFTPESGPVETFQRSVLMVLP